MASTVYHSSLYDGSRAVNSYWEDSIPGPRPQYAPLERDESCDVAVIGGGYTGLSAALHLARDHALDVRVLDTGHIGWGASGRNGGFCCLAASKLSIDAMIARYGLDETKGFYAAQLDGIALVESLAEDEGIDFDRQGDGNLEVAHKPSALKDLEDYASALRRVSGIKTRVMSKQEFAEVGHESSEQFGALHMDAGFALHPLKFHMGLAAAAQRRGARLHPHSEVLSWTKDGGGYRLATAGGSLKASHVILAANGFMPEDLDATFKGRILPVISNILTTRPLSEAELSAQSWKTESPICNTRNLLFYYRLLKDRRLLIGARGDLSGRPEDGEKLRRWLTRRVGELFPAWKDAEITHFWRGLVCMSLKMTPSIGRLEDDPSVHYAFGYHANGVNTAPWAGRAVARAIAGSNSGEPSVPAVMKGLPRRIPFAAARLWGLRGAYLYYRLKDDFL